MEQKDNFSTLHPFLILKSVNTRNLIEIEINIEKHKWKELDKIIIEEENK